MQGNCTASGPVYESYIWQIQLAAEPDETALALRLRWDLRNAIAALIAEPSERSKTPCILRLDAGLLVSHSQLWLDGLHLDVHPAGAAVRPVIETSPAQPQRPQPSPALWMTDVTVGVYAQTLGRVQGSVRGLRTAGTTVLLESAPPALRTIIGFVCVLLGDGARLRRHAPAPGRYHSNVGTCTFRKHCILLLTHL